MNTQHAKDTGTSKPGTTNPATSQETRARNIRLKAKPPEEHPSDIPHFIKAQGHPDLLGLMATPGGTPPG